MLHFVSVFLAAGSQIFAFPFVNFSSNNASNHLKLEDIANNLTISLIVSKLILPLGALFTFKRS
jgi:hypothetical protein